MKLTSNVMGLASTLFVSAISLAAAPTHLRSSQVDGEPISGCGEQKFVPQIFLFENIRSIHEYDAKFPNNDIELERWNLTSIDHVAISYDLKPIQASFYFSELAAHKGFVALHDGIEVTFDLCTQTVISISPIKY